jgi:hypothetical protein
MRFLWDSSGSRTISAWTLVVGTTVGAALGWGVGHFYQGQCDTPQCSQKSANYPTEGLLIGAGVGLVSGIAISVLRSHID